MGEERGEGDDSWLRDVIENRAEDQWELWELIDRLAARGFTPQRIWRARTGEPESICRVVAPDRPRVYSISSAMEDSAADGGKELHLTLGRLRYETEASEVSVSGTRFGTASSFLTEAGDNVISLQVIRPTRFSLPADASRPIVLFAGGTGLAPFRAMLLDRARQGGSGPSWLYFGTRSRDELYYADDLARLLDDGQLELRVAFSRDDVRLAEPPVDRGRLSFEPAPRRRITEEMLDDRNAGRLRELIDEGACIYVCGRAGFARSVMSGIAELLAASAQGAAGERESSARESLYRLVGEGRYRQEVFTTYTGVYADSKRLIDASEVALHNTEEHGYWIVVDGRVYERVRADAPWRVQDHPLVRRYGCDRRVQDGSS
jgi:sulfite reductase (NADPH) flavoprotein alpha-component